MSEFKESSIAEDARTPTGGPMDYGESFWCVGSKLSKSDEISLHADAVEVSPVGDLLFYGSYLGKEEKTVTFVLPNGQWNYCYAASVFDGSPIAVEKWKGLLDTPASSTKKPR